MTFVKSKTKHTAWVDKMCARRNLHFENEKGKNEISKLWVVKSGKKNTEINALLNNMCVTNRWKLANLTWNIAILKWEYRSSRVPHRVFPNGYLVT